MKPEAHGGDLRGMATASGRDPASLLDFSVNVRPEGAPEFLRAALLRATSALAAYPSPHAEEALDAAARRHGLPASRFAFGNGSNELIHALARALQKRGAPAAFVVEPAFSEYALACRLAGLKVERVWGGIAAPEPRSQREPASGLTGTDRLPIASAQAVPDSFSERKEPAYGEAEPRRDDAAPAPHPAAAPPEERASTPRTPSHAPSETSGTVAARASGIPTAGLASEAALSSVPPTCFSETSLDRPGALPDPLLDALSGAPAGSAVVLANPGNPSGLFREPDACLHLMASRPDLLWIIDEAFIEYAGPEAEASVLRRMPENGVSLRSLTKFHAVPGVRLGYLAASDALAAAVRAELPAWTVNAFALAAAVAALDDASDFADRTRAENAERRAHLVAELSGLPGVEAFPSAANYVLFRWIAAPRDLHGILLKRFGIAVRDCSNYHGLEDGTWFRAAVRFPEDHRRLVEALREIGQERRNDMKTAGRDAFPGDGERSHGMPSSRPARLSPEVRLAGTRRPETPSSGGFARPLARSPLRTPALMLQGTSSNAGKSILAAAYCRIFRQDGYDVAPFKAQNMSLNSGVTATGDEMGRAQIVQAQAARTDPDARMNPILLKPHSDTGSQVVVLGKPIGHMRVLEYFQKKTELWSTVTEAYDALAAEHDIIVLEGAGSPGEINLKSHDLVNMRMADYARASVLLVGDIDRGGVYASFLGTWMTFTDAERRLLTGYLVNRFRGDASLLGPAHQYLLDHTGVPVLGTVPYIRDLNIPEEDMAGFPWGQNADCGPKEPGTLDIAVVMLRHVSNFTDFAPLAAEPDVRLRPVRRAEEWGDPDVVMLPGSKSVVPDLDDLRRSGLADRILAHAAGGKWLFGICGGLQLLGAAILDPNGVESAAPEVPGLGLMDLRSTFAADKTLVRVDRAETPLGVPSGGYEIHHGVTAHGPSARPLFLRTGPAWTSEAERVCGYVSGRRWATYLHGVFDDDAFRRAWLDHVRADIGLAPQGRLLASYDLEKALDRLADIVREHSDMQTLYKSMGLK